MSLCVTGKAGSLAFNRAMTLKRDRQQNIHKTGRHLLWSWVIPSRHKKPSDFGVIKASFVLVQGICADKRRVESTVICMHVLQAGPLQRAGVVAARGKHVALDLSGNNRPNQSRLALSDTGNNSFQ